MEAKKYNIDLEGKNKEELAMVEEILERLNIPFKEDKSPYNKEFVKMIKERESQYKAGKFKKFDNAQDAINHLNDDSN